MLSDSSEDLDEDLNALDINLDFKHAAASQERFERLLFPKDFPGANSRERLAHLISITTEVEGTDGGVRITRESVNQEGYGLTVAAAMSQERERMKELTDRYGGEIPCNPIVGIHYSMYVGDDLLDKPLDYSFDRGISVEKGQLEIIEIGRGSCLSGLEEALMHMTRGSQHFVILSPKWAYGRWGLLPLIPGNATLVFQVHVRYIHYELEDRFVRMPMRQRSKVPLKAVMANCKRLKVKAKASFEKTSDSLKMIDTNTGEESINRAKNRFDYWGAEQAGEILEKAVQILERAVAKNKEEEHEMKKFLIYLHADACLAYRKAKPSLFLKAIENGQRCLVIFDELRELFKDDQTKILDFLDQYYKKINKTRSNLMEVYSRDPERSFIDALTIYQDYETELHHQEDDIPYSKHINKKERENFSRMKKLIEYRKDKWLEKREEVDTEEESESDEENNPVRSKKPKHFKRLTPKGLTLEKAIEELNKEDQEKPKDIPRSGSVVSNLQLSFKFPAIFSNTVFAKNAGNLRYFAKI